MSEISLMWIGVGKIVLCLLAAITYSLGGRDDIPKAIRRFVGPFILVGGIMLYSLLGRFSLYYLLSYPLYCLSYSLGYGAQEWEDKVIKRSKCALAITLAGLPIAFITGTWVLFTCQVMIALVASIGLGVWNPLKASQEELVIGFLTIILVPFYV